MIDIDTRDQIVMNKFRKIYKGFEITSDLLLGCTINLENTAKIDIQKYEYSTNVKFIDDYSKIMVVVNIENR